MLKGIFMATPIFIQDLVGTHTDLLTQVGTHTIKGPAGFTDMVIRVWDENGDGLTAVEVTKYGRFGDTKVPTIIATDSTEDGVVDSFRVIAKRWGEAGPERRELEAILYPNRSVNEVAEDISFEKAVSDGFYTTHQQFYGRYDDFSSSAVMSLVAYDVMGLCEWNFGEKLTDLCSWINERPGSAEVGSVSQALPVLRGDPDLHPSSVVMRKYMEWCSADLTGPEGQSPDVDLSFSSHSKENTTTDEGRIVLRHEQKQCKGSCEVSFDGSPLRQVDFDVKDCSAKTERATVTDWNPEGWWRPSQELAVDLALTERDLLFAPLSGWKDAYLQYCHLDSELGRADMQDTSHELKIDLNDSCSLSCTSSLGEQNVRSVQFVDTDCNGFPEERHVSEFSMGDGGVLLWEETVPMARHPQLSE